MTQRPWSPSDLSTLHAEFLKGTTLKSIGIILGRSKNSVVGKCNRLYLCQSKPKPNSTITLSPIESLP